MSIDYSIFQIIYGLANKWWPLDWLGVFLAQYSAYLMVLLAVFILIRESNWRRQIYFFALSALSVILSRGIIAEAIKFFYYRPRPFLALEIQPLINHDLASSFPSGHAAAYFALGLAIFYFVRQKQNNSVEQAATKSKWDWWPLITAFLIGTARIFVGVHWPSDILAGAFIGLVSAFIVKSILLKQVKPA